jgi:hypothetical protein
MSDVKADEVGRVARGVDASAAAEALQKAQEEVSRLEIPREGDKARLVSLLNTVSERLVDVATARDQLDELAGNGPEQGKDEPTVAADSARKARR